MLRVLVASSPCLAVGQFGGGGYTPPPPKCKPFTCGEGEWAVGKPDVQIWSYGCKDSGVNFMDMSSFDMNDPLGGMNKQKSPVDKCCIERDICKQTCGMSAKQCHDGFQKCSAKVCKGNKNCEMQAMFADIVSDPVSAEEEKDPLADRKCIAYEKAQKENCQCVPKTERRSANERKLKAFYQKFNPEKLESDGTIKDAEGVWKKWAGKEPEMFMALATKYKDKAVEIREKPKPPPYTPPKKAAEADDAASESSDGDAAEPETPSSSSGLTEEDQEFEDSVKKLQTKKAAAVEEEDYDAADKAKEEILALKEAEAKRLGTKKAAAIDQEDYAEAKRLKQRLARMSEL